MSTPAEERRPVKIVVLGGGFAGLAFCRTLGDDDRYAITLIDRQNHHLFQPLLYQVATAGLSAPEIAQPIRALLRGQRNVTVLMEEATGVDPDAKRVRLRGQTLEYDYLLIALGARTGYFGKNEWARHAPGLKTLDDATRVRSEVLRAFERAEACSDPAERERLLTIVVAGGGPTGVEMAGALAELAKRVLAKDFRRIQPEHTRVVLIEAGERLLTAFPEDLSEYARERLEKMGVQVRLGAPVLNIGPSLVTLPDGDIHAENIIWAAGVEAEPLARSLGVPVDRGGRLQVLPDLSLPGHPEVFAAGDIVALTDKNGVRVPGVAPAATQMGRHAAKVIAAELRHREKFTGGQQRAAFAYFNKGNMATIGRSGAVAEVAGVKFRGLVAWFMWLFIHLLFLVGLRNRIAVFTQWVYAYVTWRRGARVITRPPARTRGETRES